MSGPLAGLRVLDLGTVVAGPVIARTLGDFGAQVIKVEHPVHGDPARQMGWQVADAGGAPVSLWWKVLSRNKIPVTLDLSTPRGAELCRALVARCDVVVESFRPGTLERWGLGPDVLLEANPRVVITRVSGFGQTGPYAHRPGFGTLAEAMSGFAGAQGAEGEPPQLPSMALADETAAAWGVIGTLAALHHVRDSGAGQVVDVSLYEPLFGMLGPVQALFDQTGEEAPRLGNRLPFVSPRGAYRTADDSWLALSGSAPAAARRVLAAIGGEALAGDPRFATNEARLRHATELDDLIAAWVRERPLDDALRVLADCDVPAAPVYRMADAFADPHFQARGSVASVPDPDLGRVAMAGVTPRLTGTPGAIRWAGRSPGDGNDEVYRGLLGLDETEVAQLRRDGVI